MVGYTTKFCAAFQQIIDDAGIERIPLPVRSPNLNAYAERWVRSVKDEALSRMILFGESSLRHVLKEYVVSFNQARPHQGIQQRIPAPLEPGGAASRTKGRIIAFPVLGGLHHDYRRAA